MHRETRHLLSGATARVYHQNPKGKSEVVEETRYLLLQTITGRIPVYSGIAGYIQEKFYGFISFVKIKLFLSF